MDALKLYDRVCAECSVLTTKAYSTSFSLGIQFLGQQLREPIYSIYGYVRFADEIVDTFHHADKASLFERFKKDTEPSTGGGHQPQSDSCMLFNKSITNIRWIKSMWICFSKAWSGT